MFDLLFPKWWSTLKKLIWLKAAALSSAVVKTVTAAIVHIKDALAKPAQNVTIAIEPVQAGTGDPSPDNVRPITGWAGANVTRTGKNLFDASRVLSLTGWTETDGVYSGNSKQLNQFNFFENSPHWAGQLSIKFSGYVDDPALRAGYLIASYTDGTSNSLNIIGRSWRDYALVTTSGKTVDRIYFLNSNDRGLLFKNFQIELSSTATTYAPYTGTTYSITFPTPPGTVYGGTLDVTTGELTVTHLCETIRTSDLVFQATSANNTTFRFSVSQNRATTNTTAGLIALGYMCDRFAVVTQGGIPGAPANTIRPEYNGNNKNNYLALPVEVATVADAVDYVGASFQYRYPLVTPTTYQLTPQEVQLLAGENNIWADTGDLTLTYMADGRADDIQALNILLGGRYVNNGGADEATDKEALEILLGGTK